MTQIWRNEPIKDETKMLSHEDSGTFLVIHSA